MSVGRRFEERARRGVASSQGTRLMAIMYLAFLEGFVLYPPSGSHCSLPRVPNDLGAFIQLPHGAIGLVSREF